MPSRLTCCRSRSLFTDSLGRFESQIAIGVILAWTRTVYHEFELLAGKSAPHDFIHLLIYNAATFSEDIEKVDTVRAYHVRGRSRETFGVSCLLIGLSHFARVDPIISLRSMS